MSKITIDKENDIVVKEILDNKWTRVDKPFEREIEWLIRMRDFDRVPKIKEIICPNKIIMTYCGEPITKNNIPQNWKEQAEYILQGLKEHQCCHNDIKPEEILVKNNTLYLIDFNWATSIGEKIPTDWPLGLGCNFKPNYGFDDRYSFYLSMSSIIGI